MEISQESMPGENSGKSSNTAENVESHAEYLEAGERLDADPGRRPSHRVLYGLWSFIQIS
jgi:hypothetical protein